MEDRSGGTCGCGGPTLSYTKDQILALHPPQHLPQSGRNGDDQSKASSGQVINHLRHSSFSSPTSQSPISAEGQGNSSWPPGLADWVEQRIFPVLLPQQVGIRESFLRGNIKSLQVTFPIATSCIDHWFNLVFSCRHAESEPLKTKV